MARGLRINALFHQNDVSHDALTHAVSQLGINGFKAVILKEFDKRARRVCVWL